MPATTTLALATAPPLTEGPPIAVAPEGAEDAGSGVLPLPGPIPGCDGDCSPANSSESLLPGLALALALGSATGKTTSAVGCDAIAVATAPSPATSVCFIGSLLTQPSSASKVIAKGRKEPT